MVPLQPEWETIDIDGEESEYIVILVVHRQVVIDGGVLILDRALLLPLCLLLLLFIHIIVLLGRRCIHHLIYLLAGRLFELPLPFVDKLHSLLEAAQLGFQTAYGAALCLGKLPRVGSGSSFAGSQTLRWSGGLFGFDRLSLRVHSGRLTQQKQ